MLLKGWHNFLGVSRYAEYLYIIYGKVIAEITVLEVR